MGSYHMSDPGKRFTLWGAWYLAACLALVVLVVVRHRSLGGPLFWVLIVAIVLVGILTLIIYMRILSRRILLRVKSRFSRQTRAEKGHLSLRGGAWLGLGNSNGAEATLMVSPHSLALKIKYARTYEFSRDQILDVEPYTFLPLLREGVRIRHTVGHYPEKVIL
ncbi:MAG: hypothetical protein WKF75_03090 [Singulisphaera sp.]